MRQRRERVHRRLTQETRETPVRSQGGEHALGEDVAARSSALAGESHRGAWQATSHRVAESHNRATKRTHSGRMVGVTGGSMLRRSQMVDRALGAALPPALRDGRVGKAGPCMTGLGRTGHPGGSQVSAKAGKSDRGISLEIGLFPLGMAFHQACWYSLLEWGSPLSLLSCGPASVASCLVGLLPLDGARED